MGGGLSAVGARRIRPRGHWTLCLTARARRPRRGGAPTTLATVGTAQSSVSNITHTTHWAWCSGRNPWHCWHSGPRSHCHRRAQRADGHVARTLRARLLRGRRRHLLRRSRPRGPPPPLHGGALHVVALLLRAGRARPARHALATACAAPKEPPCSVSTHCRGRVSAGRGCGRTRLLLER